MSGLKTPGGSGKRRRASDKTGRRFMVQRDSTKKRGLPTPATLPRKTKRVQNTMRMMFAAALFCVLMSTILAWRRRMTDQKPRNLPRLGFGSFINRHPLPDSNLPSHQTGHEGDGEEQGHRTAEDSSYNTTVDSLSNSASGSHAEAEIPQQDTVLAQEDPLTDEELPERIEWYSRADFKDGTRPMCRISKPYLLSNGTFLVPDWMEKYDKLLHRCGLGTHGFYSTETGPVGLERRRDIEADFTLTIHPEKFQEPTHDPSVYLTEHILKSSYLFDVFGGFAQPEEGIKEHHCYTTANDSTCALPRPVKTLLKPAIFVPKKIEMAPQTAWPRQFVDMFGEAHGHGTGVIHLNASTILIKGHEGQSDHLLGTCFRSIMTTDGMFRHLPPKALKASTFYSPKNGIVKAPKQRTDGTSCKLSIGIASSADPVSSIQGNDDLKEKIEVLGKLALPGSSLDVKDIRFSRNTILKDHIVEMQDLDIYLGASGEEMSSIGYLRSSAAVLEFMPFGIKPNAHESLARALDMKYDRMKGKPQINDFKSCLDGEIFNMRKKGTLKFTESPEWQEPVIKAWDEAVGEFVLSGSSNFDILTASPPINNYHARSCAKKQKIEISIDDAARKVIRIAKDMCSV